MKTTVGVVLIVVGILVFTRWLAYASAEVLGDPQTIAVAVVPVAFIGVGAFFTADGIAAANKNPPYDKDPA